MVAYAGVTIDVVVVHCRSPGGPRTPHRTVAGRTNSSRAERSSARARECKRLSPSSRTHLDRSAPFASGSPRRPAVRPAAADRHGRSARGVRRILCRRTRNLAIALATAMAVGLSPEFSAALAPPCEAAAFGLCAAAALVLPSLSRWKNGRGTRAERLVAQDVPRLRLFHLRSAHTGRIRAPPRRRGRRDCRSRIPCSPNRS